MNKEHQNLWRGIAIAAALTEECPDWIFDANAEIRWMFKNHLEWLVEIGDNRRIITDEELVHWPETDIVEMVYFRFDNLPIVRMGWSEPAKVLLYYLPDVEVIKWAWQKAVIAKRTYDIYGPENQK